MSSDSDLSQKVKSIALALGADLVGVCAARATPESRQLGDWLARGYAGKMDYLARTAAQREDPQQLFEGAESMVVVGLCYDPEPTSKASGHTDPPPQAGDARGIVARYAAVNSEGCRLSKAMLAECFERDFESFFALYKARQERATASADFEEAMTAYREKRDPVWS